jgi:hypothetical protein
MRRIDYLHTSLWDARLASAHYFFCNSSGLRQSAAAQQQECTACAALRAPLTTPPPPPLPRSLLLPASESSHKWNKDASDWGFTQFLPYADASNPERGYLKDDALHIKVEIQVQVRQQG